MKMKVCSKLTNEMEREAAWRGWGERLNEIISVILYTSLQYNSISKRIRSWFMNLYTRSGQLHQLGIY